MVAPAHLKKFIAEHFPPNVQAQMLKQVELAPLELGTGAMVSAEAEKILGNHAQKLYQLMSSDGEYLRITEEVASAFQR